jgi:hypothetical protein
LYEGGGGGGKRIGLLANGSDFISSIDVLMEFGGC